MRRSGVQIPDAALRIGIFVPLSVVLTASAGLPSGACDSARQRNASRRPEHLPSIAGPFGLDGRKARLSASCQSHREMFRWNAAAAS